MGRHTALKDKIVLVTALALSLTASPALAADSQFDLVCKGRYKESVDGKWKPVESRYRIDLAAQSWCNGSCRVVKQIARIETGKIVLSTSGDDFRARPFDQHEIDRVSGAYRNYYIGGIDSYRDEEGQCEPQAFSGFPTVKF